MSQSYVAATSNEWRPRTQLRKWLSRAFLVWCIAAVSIGIILLAVLIIDVAIDGAARLFDFPTFFNLDFMTNFASRFPGRAGIWAAIIGTLYMMVITAAIAFPIGIGAAVYLEEYARRSRFLSLIQLNINNLASFGLKELTLPFETKNNEMMKKYATGKYDPEEMDPIGIVKSLKKAGIRVGSNFLIGFRDESWESILETKNFAKTLFSEGLDQAGFHIPVPYPGTKDFEFQMNKPDIKKDFNENLFKYTDNMHVRGKPMFYTQVPGEDLQAAVKNFWLELNPTEYTKSTQSINLSKTEDNLPYEH